MNQLLKSIFKRLLGIFLEIDFWTAPPAPLLQSKNRSLGHANPIADIISSDPPFKEF